MSKSFFFPFEHTYTRSWIDGDERKNWKGLSALHGSTRQLNLLICPHPHPPLFKSFFSHTPLFVPLQYFTCCLSSPSSSQSFLYRRRQPGITLWQQPGVNLANRAWHFIIVHQIYFCVKVVWNIGKMAGSSFPCKITFYVFCVAGDLKSVYIRFCSQWLIKWYKEKTLATHEFFLMK